MRRHRTDTNETPKRHQIDTGQTPHDEPEMLGAPRLARVYNQLLDLERVLARKL